jgi:dihydrofolate reductase
MIMACDNNWGIGFENNLQYHFAKDLKRFKQITFGKTVVMGRKTWESLPSKLPNRVNIVISRDYRGSDKIPDLIFDNIQPVLEMSKNEDIWVIGGAEICRLFIDHIHTFELTRILSERNYDADIKFLENELDKFSIQSIINERDLDKKQKVDLEIKFISYIRKK